MAKKLPTGFTCECGENHEFPAYVFAHYDIPLIHMCHDCGRKHYILSGKATIINDDPMTEDFADE